LKIELTAKRWNFVAVFLNHFGKDPISEILPVNLTGNFMKEFIHHMNLGGRRIHPNEQKPFLLSSLAQSLLIMIVLLILQGDEKLYRRPAPTDKFVQIFLLNNIQQLLE
jgi:hypothetical protein